MLYNVILIFSERNFSHYNIWTTSAKWNSHFESPLQIFPKDKYSEFAMCLMLKATVLYLYTNIAQNTNKFIENPYF